MLSIGSAIFLALAIAVIVKFLLKNSICEYYIKSIGCFIIGFAAYTIFSILGVVFYPVRQVLLRCHAKVAYWAFITFLGLKFEIRCQENIRDDRGSVIIVNHQSVVDLIADAFLLSALPSCLVAKKEIKFIPIVGFTAWLMDWIFIDRSNSLSARAQLMLEGKKAIDRKTSIIIFPEGTRSVGAKMLPFKKGAFHVAMEAKCPIQPVVISKYFMHDSKRKFFKRGTVVLKFLPPVSTDGVTSDSVGTLCQNVQDIMQKEYDSLNEEMKPLNLS